jgi:hypothetical protein
MRETAAGIFVRSAGGLDDAIQREMFKRNYFSHGRIFPMIEL